MQKHHPKQISCKEEKEFLEESWVWNWYLVLVLAYCGLGLCGSGQIQPGLPLACFS